MLLEMHVGHAPGFWRCTKRTLHLYGPHTERLDKPQQRKETQNNHVLTSRDIHTEEGEGEIAITSGAHETSGTASHRRDVKHFIVACITACNESREELQVMTQMYLRVFGMWRMTLRFGIARGCFSK